MFQQQRTRTTLSDLAEQLQVSVSTVSRALRGKPGASPKLARDIRDLAASVGYRPNAVARSLSTGQTFTLTVVVRDLHNPYYARVLSGIYDGATGEGYNVQLQLIRVPGDVSRLWEHVAEGRTDGLVIALPGDYVMYRDFLRSLAAAHLPVVLYGPTFAPFVDSVGVDYVQAGRMAVDHLHQLGHRRIAHLSTPDLDGTDRTRLAGFRQALREHELDCRKGWIIPGTGTQRDGYRAMQRLLKEKDLPTAIVCHNDLVAIGAMGALREAHLAVPEDLSLVGFDNIEEDNYLAVKLTTVDQPAEQIGAKLVEVLLGRIADPGRRQVQTIRMHARLIVRESTAGPRQAGGAGPP